MNILQVLVQIASFITLVVAIVALYQTKKSRMESLKPILVPSDNNKIDSVEKLFAYNFQYPIQEFEFHGIAYFSIKNIGRGPACNVTLIEIHHNWKEIDFKIGTQNMSNFPENSQIPVILRIGYTDTDFHFGALKACISYEDIIGNTYFITLDLWLTNVPKYDDFICNAEIIDYSIGKINKEMDIPPVTFREIEDTGYYELNRIKKIKTSDNTPVH